MGHIVPYGDSPANLWVGAWPVGIPAPVGTYLQPLRFEIAFPRSRIVTGLRGDPRVFWAPLDATLYPTHTAKLVRHYQGSPIMTKFAYFEGAVRPVAEAKVSVMNQTFNYGTGCFGGIRGYWNAEKQQLYVFRILDHYRRFLASTKIILADFTYSPEELAAITVDLLQQEEWKQNCYIRPLAYKADNSIAVRLHELRNEVAIFSIPVGEYLPNEGGVSVGTSSWRRVDDTAIPARGKLIGSYMNSALIKSEAALNGYQDAIVLNQDGHVSEGSAANFFMVRNGVVITTPVSSNVLEGITRRTLIQLARDELGVPVEERTIDRSELYVADEAFFCGTGVQLVSITTVDRRAVGDGHPGPVTEAIRDLYFDIVYGRQPKYQDWLTPVYAS